MPARAQRSLCPECHVELRADRTKMNIDVDLCPEGHGIFLDEGDVVALVGPQTSQTIRRLIERPISRNGECPACRSVLGRVQINSVEGMGCRTCGGLWFNTERLKAHVFEVRRRAYGAGSMAARADVMRDATSFMPSEILAGILTDFQLEHEL